MLNNIKKIPSGTIVRKSAGSIFYEGGPKAILMLHGYNGHTEDLRYQAEAINNEGFTVFVPRMPGHGTNAFDFLETGANDWLRRSVDSYLDMRSDYQEVGIVGFSMGGLISIILASQFNVPKIALIAPAILNRNKNITLAPLIRFFVKRLKREWTEKTDDKDRIFLANEYWHWHYPKEISELLKLRRLATAVLPEVKSDTLVIVSKMDETVPVESAELIIGGISSDKKTAHVLNESPHVCTDGPEKEKIAKLLMDWFI